MHHMHFFSLQIAFWFDFHYDKYTLWLHIWVCTNQHVLTISMFECASALDVYYCNSFHSEINKWTISTHIKMHFANVRHRQAYLFDVVPIQWDMRFVSFRSVSFHFQCSWIPCSLHIATKHFDFTKHPIARRKMRKALKAKFYNKERG